MSIRSGVVVCDRCHQSIPAGSAVRYGAYTYCRDCARRATVDGGGIEVGGGQALTVGAWVICVVGVVVALTMLPIIQAVPVLLAVGVVVVALLLTAIRKDLRRRDGAKK